MTMKVMNKVAEGGGAATETQTTTTMTVIEKVGGGGRGHPMTVTMMMIAVRETLQNGMRTTTTEMMIGGVGDVHRPGAETKKTMTGRIGGDETDEVAMTIMKMRGEGGIDLSHDMLNGIMIMKKMTTEGGGDVQGQEDEIVAMIGMKITGEDTVPNLVGAGAATTMMKTEGVAEVVDQNQDPGVHTRTTTSGVTLAPNRQSLQNQEKVDIDKI